MVEIFVNESKQPEITPQTKNTLEKIIRTIRERELMYSSALVALALEKRDDDQLLVCYGLVTFLPKVENFIEELHYKYEKLILVRKRISVKKAIQLLRDMYENHRIDIPSVLSIPFQGTLYEFDFHESRYERGYATSGWPRTFASGAIGKNTEGTLTQEALVSLEHPLFPNGIEALREKLELNLSEDAYNLSSCIEIVIPDYRARITGLVVEGTKAALEVELGTSQSDDLRAKFYSRGRHITKVSENMSLAGNRVSFEMGDEPLIIEVHILSAKDGSTIDRTGYNYRYPYTKKGVIMKDDEVRLLDIISRGENQTVEFKEQIEKGNQSEFIETVVAFANTIGGMILIGVDDTGRLSGFTESIDADRILKWITDWCDPPIDVELRFVTLQEKTIAVVDVPEGENKPYVLKDKGPYVRKGATDRSAKRTEMDEFYREKRQSSF